jgi:hypothetical protein
VEFALGGIAEGIALKHGGFVTEAVENALRLGEIAAHRSL